jgi:GNAT superfamily N-acetyltransferase
MFAGTELARRIEIAERGLVEDCTAAIAAKSGGDRAFAIPIAGGIAAFSGADSPLTKVAGVGFEGIPSAAELERVESKFGARSAAIQFEISSLADPAIAEALTRRGYVLVGFEDVLGRTLDPRSHSSQRPDLRVDESGPEELDAWIDVVVNAFATPDAQGVAPHESFSREVLARVVREMSCGRGAVRYMARMNGVPAGGASMRTSDRVAQLCGAGTLPAHRRQGVQTALLEHRLADAARGGCDIAVVTTLPGSKSHENVQKRGFDLLYTRAILRKDAR